VRRAFVVLFVAPLSLAAALAPVVAYLATTRKLEGPALMEAIEPIAPIPVAVGFALLFVVTRLMMKRDGLTFADVGWRRPARADLVIAAVLALGMGALDRFMIHPLLATALPSHDPTLARVALLPVVVSLSVAALVEETVYRGYVLCALRARYGALVAALVTSLFYAALTPGGGLALNAYALYLGVVFSGVRLWRDNLWPGLIVHVVLALGPKIAATMGGG